MSAILSMAEVDNDVPEVYAGAVEYDGAARVDLQWKRMMLFHSQ